MKHLQHGDKVRNVRQIVAWVLDSHPKDFVFILQYHACFEQDIPLRQVKLIEKLTACFRVADKMLSLHEMNQETHFMIVNFA